MQQRVVEMGQELAAERAKGVAHAAPAGGNGGPPPPENPVESPAAEPEPVTPEVHVLPVRYRNEAHGGTLKEGGTRGPGRPTNAFRAMLVGDLEQRRQFLLDLIDGKEFVQPGMFGPILAPAPIKVRADAWDKLAKYAIGPADPGNSGDKRTLTLVFRKE